MRVPLAALPLLLSCVAAGPRDEEPARPQSPRRQLDVGIGPRAFEDDGFGRLDDHAAFTLSYCEPMGLEPLRLSGGFAYSCDEADGTAGGEDVRLEAETWELSLGVEYSYGLGRVRPYVGAGAAVLWLELDGIDADLDLAFDDDDVALGGYAKAGIQLDVSPGAFVGIEYRHFEGSEASFGGQDLSTSYDQFVLVLGTRFVTADPLPPHPLRR